MKIRIAPQLIQRTVLHRFFFASCAASNSALYSSAAVSYGRKNTSWFLISIERRYFLSTKWIYSYKCLPQSLKTPRRFTVPFAITSECCEEVLSRRRTMCTMKKEERICWNCKKKIGDEIFFCSICKIIQPPLTELSFFKIFGSKEEYFLDLKNLTNQYRRLQSMIHPDKFNNSNEAEKEYSLEQSSLINKAYNTLLDPLKRSVYLLGLNNVTFGESNTVEGTEFLMEIMEINEKLDEVKCIKDLHDIQASNNDSIDACIERLTEAFGRGDLDAAKDLTIKLRYYRNILEIIKDKTMELDK